MNKTHDAVKQVHINMQVSFGSFKPGATVQTRPPLGVDLHQQEKSCAEQRCYDNPPIQTQQ
jgi:hypothetical protein